MTALKLKCYLASIATIKDHGEFFTWKIVLHYSEFPYKIFSGGAYTFCLHIQNITYIFCIILIEL
jgi:hypothetical protein